MRLEGAVTDDVARSGGRRSRVTGALPLAGGVFTRAPPNIRFSPAVPVQVPYRDMRSKGEEPSVPCGVQK